MSEVAERGEPAPEMPWAPAHTLLLVVADIVEWVPDVVRETRKATGQTLREVERACGVSVQTLNRVESGLPCTTTTAAKLLRWAATA